MEASINTAPASAIDSRITVILLCVCVPTQNISPIPSPMDTHFPFNISMYAQNLSSDSFEYLFEESYSYLLGLENSPQEPFPLLSSKDAYKYFIDIYRVVMIR